MTYGPVRLNVSYIYTEKNMLNYFRTKNRIEQIKMFRHFIRWLTFTYVTIISPQTTLNDLLILLDELTAHTG